MKIKDKIILITGGAVRLGRAITLELVKNGAKVFCHYNESEKEAIALKKEVKSFNCSLNIIQSDFLKPVHTEKIISEILTKTDRIDILINNAAIFIKHLWVK